MVREAPQKRIIRKNDLVRRLGILLLIKANSRVPMIKEYIIEDEESQSRSVKDKNRRGNPNVYEMGKVLHTRKGVGKYKVHNDTS